MIRGVSLAAETPHPIILKAAEEERRHGWSRRSSKSSPQEEGVKKKEAREKQKEDRQESKHLGGRAAHHLHCSLKRSSAEDHKPRRLERGSIPGQRSGSFESVVLLGVACLRFSLRGFSETR
jgi:hypothetical protein